MKKLFERIVISKNGKEFMAIRNAIGKIFFGIYFVAYALLWIKFKQTSDIPDLTFYVTFTMIPILLFGLYMRAYYYLFMAHWMHILYYVATGTIFFMVMMKIQVTYKSTGVFIFESGHLFIANLFGFLIALGMSVPFKLIQWWLYEPTNIYFTLDVLSDIDKKIHPEKEKEKFKFDGLNETQLQAELSSALVEERFEDAEKIKKILETKFR